MAKRPQGGVRKENVAARRVRVVEEKKPLLVDLWRGDVPLVMSFWLFGIFAGLCFAIVFAFVDYQISGLAEGLGPLFIIGLIVSYFVYMSFVNIAIWRSANKYRGPKHWAILAKVMVLVSWTLVIHKAWQIFGGVPA